MNYKEIPLTNSNLLVKVSLEDYEILVKYKWRITNNYVVGYSKELKKNIFMHKLILDVPNGMIGDHIDRNKLNNTRENLRKADKFSNNWNKAKKKNSSSPYKGVIISNGRNGKKIIYATIAYKKTSQYLGAYITLEEAARAYNIAAKKHFGDFAFINNVPNPFLKPIPKNNNRNRHLRIGVP